MDDRRRKSMKGRKVLSFLAVACAAIVGLSAQTTVFATSRTTTTEVLGVSRSVDEAINSQVLGARRSGSVAGDNVTTGTITDQNAAKKLLDLEAIARLISKYTGRTVTAEDIAILDSMDIKPVAGTVVSKENPLFVSFTFPSVTKDTKAYVIHYENDEWTIVPTKVSEEIVVGEFVSLSPSAIVVEKNSLKGAVLGASRAISPRTGDGMGLAMYLVIGFLVVLSTVGFVSRKRSKQ